MAAAIQPFFDRLFGRVHEDLLRVRDDIGSLHTGLNGRIDHLQGLLEILDRKADGQTEASFRLSKQMGDLRDELLARLAESTQRELELRQAVDTLTLLVANSVADINDKLDRLPARIAESATRVTEDMTEVVRAELVEVARMLRMQGDAADQVAEVLGRTMVRLSAEVNALADAVGDGPGASGRAHGASEVPTPA